MNFGIVRGILGLEEESKKRYHGFMKKVANRFNNIIV